MTDASPIPLSGLRPLSGSEKVAALLLVMGKPLASRLLGHFDARELKVITRSAAELGSVPIQVLETLVEEFAGEFSDGVELRGSADRAENLLAGVLPPDQVADIMSDVLDSPNSAVWDRLATLPNEAVVAYLASQHPQVLALALSKMTTGRIAAMLEIMPRELRNEATRRLLVLGPVADAALRVVETRLKHDLLLNPPEAAGKGTSRMAEIINKMAPEHAEDMMKALEADRPQEAEAVRSKLFSFADLVTLPAATRQALFEKIPSDQIVLALATAEAEFRANILSSLTARARRLVENELNNAGVPSSREVAAARRAIADTLLDMAARGEVELREEG